MLHAVILAMVYLGSTLMVYNIYGFVRFARSAQDGAEWGSEKRMFYLPITLLVLFLLGYLGVGLFGNPDLLVAGILFGGSIFVFVMYRFLERVTKKIRDNERLSTDLLVAEKSNQVKTEFLATMSHEMRTPMNVIMGLDAIALKDPDLSPQTREYLEKIGLSAQHMLSLINKILYINESDVDIAAIKNDEFSLSAALSQINVIAQTLCEGKGLDYAVESDDTIHDACVGDETQVKEVLLSLLDNAVKYTEAPGSVSLRIRLCETANDAQTVSFTVSDTGIGMSEDFLSQLFVAFSQEDGSMTSRYGGSGLSLARSKSVVDRMGGSIEATSKKGEGSTFVVTLPFVVVCKTGEEAADASTSALEEQQGVESLEGRCVLVVEDQETNAEIVADLLEIEGAQTEHAENGQVAVEMVAKSQPYYYDAILMDLRMPVMDGYTATRHIRGLDRPDAQAVPIIALTANAFQSDVDQSLDAGMNAHLAKPADADLLYKTLMENMREKPCQGE